MTRSRSILVAAVATTVIAAVASLSWQTASFAQPGGGAGFKLPSNIDKTKGAFEALLAAHGNKNMLLAVTIRVAGPKVDSVEHLGKLVQSTDSFLVIKLQNQQDLVFIPWEHVLWVTARPAV